eukprot:672175_1
MDLSTYVYILPLLSLLTTQSLGETLTHLNITNGVLECTLPGLCTLDCTEGPTTWLCHATDMICLDGYDCLIMCGNADCLEGSLRCPNGGRCDIIGDCDGSSTGSCFNNKDIYCPPSDHECTMDVKFAPVGQLKLYSQHTIIVFEVHTNALVKHILA